MAFAVGAWATGARLPGATLGVSALSSVADTAGSNTSSTLCQAFVDRFAQDLGKPPEKLRSPAQKPADQVAADAVKSGKLTADQAAKLRRRLGGGSVCKKVGANGKTAAKLVVGQVYLQAAAQTLSQQPAEL